MTRNELVAFCESKGIVLEAWGPLVRGQRFKHPDILRLAEKYERSPAQILIRYGLDRGFVVIPKSTKQERIKDNTNVFDFTLEKEDVDYLTSLDEFLITVSSPETFVRAELTRFARLAGLGGHHGSLEYAYRCIVTLFRRLRPILAPPARNSTKETSLLLGHRRWQRMLLLSKRHRLFPCHRHLFAHTLRFVLDRSLPFCAHQHQLWVASLLGVQLHLEAPRHQCERQDPSRSENDALPSILALDELPRKGEGGGNGGDDGHAERKKVAAGDEEEDLGSSRGDEGESSTESGDGVDVRLYVRAELLIL